MGIEVLVVVLLMLQIIITTKVFSFGLQIIIIPAGHL
jgi:hypothetical protein